MKARFVKISGAIFVIIIVFFAVLYIGMNNKNPFSTDGGIDQNDYKKVREIFGLDLPNDSLIIDSKIIKGKDVHYFIKLGILEDNINEFLNSIPQIEKGILFILSSSKELDKLRDIFIKGTIITERDFDKEDLFILNSSQLKQWKINEDRINYAFKAGRNYSVNVIVCRSENGKVEVLIF